MASSSQGAREGLRSALTTNDVTREVSGVQFSLVSNDEKRKYYEVIHPVTISSNQEILVRGLADGHMGASPGQRHIPCEECGCGWETCPGHVGRIHLKQDIIHPYAKRTVQNVLQVICIACKTPYFAHQPDLMAKIQKYDASIRLTTLKECLKGVKECPACLHPRPVIKQPPKRMLSDAMKIKDDTPPGYFYIVEYPTTKEYPHARRDYLTPEKCRAAFVNIKDPGHLRTMGFSPEHSSPESLIFDDLVIGPNNIRPMLQSPNGVYETDFTHICANILKKIKEGEYHRNAGDQGDLHKKYATMVHILVNRMFTNDENDMAVGFSNGHKLKSLKELIGVGKASHIRQHLNAKRCDGTGRTVITGNPNMSITQVGVPVTMAKILTVREVVTYNNIAQLQEMVKRGPDGYPGAQNIVRRRKGQMFSLVTENSRQMVLEIGDKVDRHMVDGDPVLMNRQPSLHKMNMMCFYAKIMHDTLTFNLHPADTKPFNADFDGDEMNVHVPQSAHARFELEYLSNVKTNIVSAGKSMTSISLIQDWRSAACQMTKDNITLDKIHVARLIAGCKLDEEQRAKMVAVMADVSKTLVTAHEIISIILPASLCMKRKDYEIRNGNLIRGFFGNSAIGESSNNVIHVINNQFGEDAAVRFINNMVFISNNYLLIRGLTLGLSDIVLAPDVEKKCMDLIETTVKEVTCMYKDFQANADIINPLLNEMNMFDMLSVVRADCGKIIEDRHKADAENGPIKNSMYAMAFSKAKGSSVNSAQICALMGQQELGSLPERFKKTCNQRTLPCFAKNDDSPEARGFVRSSLGRGLNPAEFIMHAIAGRVGMINGAIKTSETGYIARKFVKGMEDIMRHHDGTVRSANLNIVQFTYGDVNMDSSKNEFQTCRLLKHATVDEMKAAYSFPADSTNEGYMEKLGQMWLRARKIACAISGRSNPIIQWSSHTFYSPVNLGYILDCVLASNRQQGGELILTPQHVHASIESILSDANAQMLYYGAGSQGALAQRDNRRSSETFEILLNATFAPKLCIDEYKLNKAEFDKMMEEIKARHVMAMVQAGEMVGILAAQFIGEPTTQATLDSFHSTGIGKVQRPDKTQIRLHDILACSKNPKVPVMFLFLEDKIRFDRSKADQIKTMLNTTVFGDIVESMQVFWDPAVQYAEEDNITDVSFSLSSLNKELKPRDLPWLFRIQLNREQVSEKGVSMLDIKLKFLQFLRGVLGKSIKKAAEKYLPQLVNRCMMLTNDDNSKSPIVHVRFDLVGVEAAFTPRCLDYIAHFHTMLMEKITLNGIAGIKSVEVDEWVDYKTPDGPKEYVLFTRGVNMVDIRYIRGLNLERSYTNSMHDNLPMFGVEVTRDIMLTEFRQFSGLSDVNYQHFAVLVDFMTHTGSLTAVNRHGINKLASRAPLAKASFEEAVDVLMEAGIHGERDDLTSVSSNVILGQRIRAGTGLCDIGINPKLLRRTAGTAGPTSLSMLQPDPFIEDIMSVPPLPTGFQAPN